MGKDNKRNFHILIVDDEPLIRQSLYEILRIEGYGVQVAGSAEAGLEVLAKHPSDVVITDMKLPHMSGIKFLEQLRQVYPKTDIILITGYGSIETAVEAMKKGAYDYVTKPLNDQEIKMIINKLVEKRQLLEENVALRELVAKTKRHSLGKMIGFSDKMQKVYRMIEAVAPSNATIMITGESGTGKGLVAQAIHQCDPKRKDKPFVEVSCGALTETLLESELFGHIKGAFTGAIRDKEGRFEYANGGTAFLDEIDAFSPNLQVKLLKVLQDGIFERVGESIPRKTEARIIVATNQDLTKLVEENKFREDLYYRVNVIAIEVPPLRERLEDIDPLMDHYVKYYSEANHKNVTAVSDDVRKIFQSYDWPGNVRELENAIEGAVIMVKTEVIHKWDIPNASKFNTPSAKILREKSLKRVMENPEREHIIAILEDCRWNRNKAAEVLGVNRTTLYNKMKKYNIVGNHKTR